MTNEINVSRIISLFGMPLRYYRFVSPRYEDTPGGKACRRCAKRIPPPTYRIGRKGSRGDGTVARTANKIKNENSSRGPKLIISGGAPGGRITEQGVVIHFLKRMSGRISSAILAE